MNIHSVQFSCSVVSDSLRPHGLQHTRPPVHHELPELTQTHVHWVGDGIQLSHPLSSRFPPTFNLPQHQGLFKWVSSSHQVAKVVEFQLQHQSFQWILGLISFRMDWLDHLAIQGALKSLLQHHSSKHHFFSTQLSLWSNSHIYTRLLKKPKALTDGLDITRKIMSLLFNMLSRLVIAFLPRIMCLLISWLLSPYAVILESPQNKICHSFPYFPIYLPWSDGIRCHDLSFPNVEF